MAKRPWASSMRAPASVSKRNLVFALGGIRTVAGKALVGENRADIAIEFDFLAAEHSRGKTHEYANRNAPLSHDSCRFPLRKRSNHILHDPWVNFVNSDTTLEFRSQWT